MNTTVINFNQISDLSNRRKLFSIPVAEYASFSQARTFKTDLSLIPNFFRYYFKTGTLCLLFLSSHVFPALEFASNYFGIQLWKIVKLRDHNETKPPIRKIFRKYKPIRHYFVMSRKYCRAHLQTKFTTVVTRYPTSKRIKNATPSKPLFRRKWTFLSKLDLSDAIHWQYFKSLPLRP